MKKIIKRIAPLCLMLWLLVQSVSAVRLLVPGGQVVGLALSDNTVTVAAFDQQLGRAAKAAGVKVGDRIVSVDNRQIHTAQDIHTALQQSDGAVEIGILRDGKTKKVHLEPAITEDGPRLGIYLKQGVTGIGTVTWYDADTGAFGALGHGVNRQNGELVVMQEGSAYSASVVSVRKGVSGDPGQLMGTLTDRQPIGVLTKNTVQGVFGTLDVAVNGQPIPVADSDEIRTGPARIRSTISDSQIQEYSVEILKIYPNSGTTGRNMLLKVTDQRLLDTTGGIVQGMSGSPIIQDGKLVGAVTHVLVNDPQTGYGIFIENMLDAAA